MLKDPAEGHIGCCTIAAVREISFARSADDEIVERVLSGETEFFEGVMRRYNARLFRVARAVLRDEAEAEDVVQETWLRAFRGLSRFERRSSLATWLTRIALHEAWARSRRRRFAGAEEPEDRPHPGGDPEAIAFRREVRAHVARRIDDLSDRDRVVLVMRDVEGLDTAETARCLGISRAAVKVRLCRARARLRARLVSDGGTAGGAAFQFAGPRCDGMVARVMGALAAAKMAVSA